MRLDVKGYHHAYPVHIGKGMISNLGAVLDTSIPTAIITDDGVPPSYIETVSKQLKVKTTVCVRAGEGSKSFDTYQDVLLKLQKAGLDRSDRLIAVGGGMVSDLGGFAAATYKRGIAFIILPTTLLSMVDASIGGKVAINTSYAKNSVGAFHTPQSVIIDPSTLKTLPERHFSNGMAEVIKTALIGDRALFEHLKTNPSKPDQEHIIQASLNVKAKIVEEDPLDKGKRGLLNYGHTIGHAIERESGYQLLHGECVAMGMQIMARGRKFETDLLEVLTRYNLKRETDLDSEVLMKRIREDKKVMGDHIDIADVTEVGNGFIERIKINDFFDRIKGGTPL